MNLIFINGIYKDKSIWTNSEQLKVKSTFHKKKNLEKTKTPEQEDN